MGHAIAACMMPFIGYLGTLLGGRPISRSSPFATNMDMCESSHANVYRATHVTKHVLFATPSPTPIVTDYMYI